MDTQKEALKNGRLDAACRRSPDIEPPEVDDEQAPVRTCHRYFSARADHLNYHDALANDLPIGSGEIESAHRYIAQQRLKRPGAWWRVDHAEYMLALRINRINGDWAAYWKPSPGNRPARQSEQPGQITMPQRECITLDRTRLVSGPVGARLALDGFEYSDVINC